MCELKRKLRVLADELARVLLDELRAQPAQDVARATNLDHLAKHINLEHLAGNISLAALAAEAAALVPDNRVDGNGIRIADLEDAEDALKDLG